ncbi:MAG: hypothetical protein ABR562_00245 [Thermoplasmatota archaeon]
MPRPAWLLTLVLLVPAGFAHDESQAGSLDARVLRAWHEPDGIAGSDTWRASIQLAPGSNVTSALFQVCLVGQACFAPPAPADAAGNRTFTFTSDHAGAAGGPVRLSSDSSHHVGVKWYLQASDGSLAEFPPDPSALPECADAASLQCQEDHYLTFWTLHRDTPAPAAPLLGLLLLAGAVFWRRHD